MKPPYHIACTRIIDAHIKQEAKSRGLLVEDKELIHIDLLESPEVVEKIRQNALPFIFTSQYGVKAVHNLIQKYQIKLDNNSAYCISGKTARDAKDVGFQVQETASNSDLLAKKIAELKDKTSYLHAGANLGLTEWKTYLSSKHISIQTIHVYYKILCTHTFTNVFAVMFFSPTQIDTFLQANTLTEQIPAFCIGETTASHLSKHHHKNIFVANEPSERAMFDLVYSYYNLQT